MSGWVDSLERLPALDVWVSVLVDDRDNPQDVFINDLLKREDRYLVRNAKLARVDEEGWPHWRGAHGSSVENVTKWHPAPEPPPKESPTGETK